MNDKVPIIFHKRPVFVCLLTERSDGHLIDFRRMSAKNLSNGQDLLMSTEILLGSQYITCYVMCEAVAGTLRYAELKPELPAHLFPTPCTKSQEQQPAEDQRDLERIGGRPAEEPSYTSPATLENDEFAENEIDDQDMVNAALGMDFNHIDLLDMDSNGRKTKSGLQDRKKLPTKQPTWNPERLNNGKWACNHKCKDKTICKHMCCRDGVDKPPKPPKDILASAVSVAETSTLLTTKGKNASLSATNKATSSNTSTKGQTAQIETINLTNQANGDELTKRTPRNMQNLQRLHDKVVNCPSTPADSLKESSSDYFRGDKQLKLSYSDKYKHRAESSDRPSTDYEDEWLESLPSPSALLANEEAEGEPPVQEKSTDYGSSWHDGLPSPFALLRENDPATKDHFYNDIVEDFELSQFNDADDKADMEAAMVGLSDSITMKKDSQAHSAPINIRQSKTANGLQRTADHGTSFVTLPTTQLKASSASSASSKLFLSTDSPEKSTDLPQKRKHSLIPEAENPISLTPVPKRPRVKDQTDAVLQYSSNGDDYAAGPVPMVKPGLPAWVYEFDPEFIAEYQDFVDFV